MKRFIAYFDFLGYKELILNNSSEQLQTITGHILRDIEMALGQGKFTETRSGRIVSDIDKTKINCLNISDTVMFYTPDDSLQSLQELLQVAYRFNWQEILYGQPVRGVICYDELDLISGSTTNTAGAIYSANLMYGKGLVNAHLKAENLNWAGTVVDNSVVQFLKAKNDPGKFLKDFATVYPVPYKTPWPGQDEEYALNTNKGGLNEIAFDNTANSIRERFAANNKPVNKPRVQELIQNTINFLETFRD